MPGVHLKLEMLAGTYAVARLAPADEIPGWALTGSFASLTRTADELSIVCEAERVPPEVPAQTGFVGLRAEGPLDFNLTGILASLAVPLAEAGISLFAISTYDTDYLFLPADREAGAVAALTAAGHTVRARPVS